MKTNAHPIGGTASDRAWLPALPSGCPEKGNRGCANIWFDAPTLGEVDGEFKGGLIRNYALSHHSSKEQCMEAAVGAESNFFDCSAPRTPGAQELLYQHLREARDMHGWKQGHRNLTDDFEGKKEAVRFGTTYRCCCTMEDKDALPVCKLKTSAELKELSFYGGCGGLGKYRSYLKEVGTCEVSVHDPNFNAFTGKTSEDLTRVFGDSKSSAQGGEVYKCCCKAGDTAVECTLKTESALTELSFMNMGTSGCGNLGAGYHSFNSMPKSTNPDLENLGKCVVQLDDPLLSVFTALL